MRFNTAKYHSVYCNFFCKLLHGWSCATDNSYAFANSALKVICDSSRGWMGPFDFAPARSWLLYLRIGCIPIYRDLRIVSKLPILVVPTRLYKHKHSSEIELDAPCIHIHFRKNAPFYCFAIIECNSNSWWYYFRTQGIQLSLLLLGGIYDSHVSISLYP